MISATHDLPVNVPGAPDIPVNIADIYPSQPFNAMSIAAWRPTFTVSVGSIFSPARYSRRP